MTTRILCSMLLTAALCSAQANRPSSDTPQEIPVFDVNAIDKSADPCGDFYQYACGTWMKNNPIPPDKSRWGRFDALYERNLYILRDILTEAHRRRYKTFCPAVDFGLRAGPQHGLDAGRPGSPAPAAGLPLGWRKAPPGQLCPQARFHSRRTHGCRTGP